MTTKKVETARERAARIIAEMRSLASVNEHAGEDLIEANEAIAEAEGEERADAIRAAAPQTRNETVDAAHEDMTASLRANERAIADALDLVKDNADEARKLRAELKAVKAKLARQYEFDASGKPRMALTRDFHRSLLTMPTNDEQIRKLQADSDVLMMLGSILDYRAKFSGRGRILPGVEDLSDLRTYHNVERQVRALYGTGSGVGDEWVPDQMSGQMFEFYEQARRVSGIFPRVQLPAGQSSTVWPLLEANPTVYLQAERTQDDGANYRASNITTAQRTMTPSTIAGRIRWSGEFDEDSVIMVAGALAKSFGKAIEKGVENAIINGDDTATHMDTGYTVASDDVRRAWNGLRDLCIAAAKMDLSTISHANWGLFFNLMGELASDPSGLVLIPSNKTYWKHIVADSTFTDASKLPQGMAPSHTSGSVGKFFGADVVPSGLLAQNLNASGIYDGSTTTYTACLACRPDQYILGERRGMTLETDKDIESGQMIMVCTMRATFKKLANLTTVASEALGYKIS